MTRLLPLLCVALSLCANGWCAETPPNVILILLDDLGYGDLTCYNSKSGNDTPNIDRLAAEGMRFTNFYVSSSVCSPSRASLLTGCYHRRIGVDHVLWPVSVAGLSPAETTIAEVLRQRGYATAYLGKWHVGDQVEFLPTRQGFDSYFGLPYSHDMQSLLRVRRTEETVLPVKIRALPLYRDEKPVALVTNVRKLTERYRNEALSFIAQQHEAKRPFFLFMGHNAVHFPMQPSKDFRNQSKNGPLGDWLEEVDAGLGALLALVQSLGIDEQTLILLLSDNGPANRTRGNTGNLRGGKHSTWDGGMKVPLLVRWPGTVLAGKVCGELTSAMDLLPTVARFAGAEIQSLNIDGLDLSSLLTGKAEASPRDVFYYYHGNRLSAIRDQRWKLHLKGPEGEPRMLFDLQSDPGETKDLAAQQPEIVAKLSARAEAAAHLLGNGGQRGAVERPPGRVSRLQPIARALPVWGDNDEELEPPETGKAMPISGDAPPVQQAQIP
jgi:arylsulfatase A-like enzyme